MNRTRWLAVVAMGLLGAGIAVQWRRAAPPAGLDCPPESVRFRVQDGQRIAHCGEGALPTPAEARTLGLKLGLNSVPEEALAQVPGVGRSLAKALVAARPFQTWDDVDAVAGVGNAKLEVLRAATDLH